MAKSRFSTVNFGSSKASLLTVGYAIYNTDATVNKSRTTSGVSEFGTATGVYGAYITIPTDKPVLVLWDTGEATPRYGSEDNNIQIDSIQNETDTIRLIYNSIKNQGEFFTKVMDKLGLLEKNKGLAKDDIKEIVDGIKFPEQKEVVIPEFPKIPEFPNIPDYNSQLSEIKSYISSLLDAVSSIKPEVTKLDTVKIEKMVSDLSGKIESLPKYESQFSNVQKMISESFVRVSNSITDQGKETASGVNKQNLILLGELKKLHAIFSRLDSLMSKINDFNKKLSQLDSNDKELNIQKKLIQKEISSLKFSIVDRISLMENRPTINAKNERFNTLVRTFGRK